MPELSTYLGHSIYHKYVYVLFLELLTLSIMQSRKLLCYYGYCDNYGLTSWINCLRRKTACIK